MNAPIEIESTLTDRYQTTVPETVRRALKLAKRDRIHYEVHLDGTVTLTRAKLAEPTDPLIDQFLKFLAQDIADQPKRLIAVESKFVQHIQNLVAGVDVDLTTALAADDE